MRRGIALAAAIAAVTGIFGASASAQQPGYDENANYLNAWGRTQADFTNPEKTVNNFVTSIAHVAAALEEPDRLTAGGGPQFQIQAWPWNGDPNREDYEGIELRYPERDGVSLAGTLWPAKSDVLADENGRVPGVIINEGSLGVQPMYFWAAHELANSGYNVMTFDVENQGKSDAGSISADNLRDTIDFFLSTPDAPYEFGGEVPFNPLHDTVDPDRIGTAGHSMGAGHVQQVGDYDGKVKAISAWSDMSGSYAGDAPLQGQGADYETWILPPQPTPGADENAKISRMQAIQAARGDEAPDLQEIVIEAGTHLAWSHVTWSYTSAWSEDVALFYALAWFDKYLANDFARDGVAATDRLVSNYDADGAGHGLSKKFLSAYSLNDGGLTCGDMVGREGC